jgi:hypothetical protein
MRRIHSKHSNRVLWLIEQRDVGITHVLRNGPDNMPIEHTLRNDDVGMVYVVNSKEGDSIDFPPIDVVLDDDVHPA